MARRRDVLGARVLLTGASSGIGWHLALLLAERGAHVLATARRAERLNGLLAEFSRRSSLPGDIGSQRTSSTLQPDPAAFRSGSLSVFAGDITSAEHRQRLLKVCTEKWGALDCLINNAGAGAIGPYLDASEDRLRRVMEVDFFAPAGLIRDALPLLQQGRRSAIVNVGSVLSHRAVPNKSEYCAAKFALRGLSESLRCELIAQGVQVIVVNPSTTRSDFFDALIDTDGRKKANSVGSMSAERVARARYWTHG